MGAHPEDGRRLSVTGLLWDKGYTLAELEDAQARYDLTFPPDLFALLRERRPVQGYDWRGENPDIRKMLDWPFDMLAWDIEQDLWWPDWGDRPASKEEREAILRDALDLAPRLIPLVGHRFLPESPGIAGNPVFSMHGFDTIYYGSNLETFFRNESTQRPKIEGPFRHVAFWSDIAEHHGRAYEEHEKTHANK